MVPKEWQGRALGAFQLAAGLAALPASAIFGLLYRQLGAAIAFGAGAMLAVLATMALPKGRIT
jgi:hypothetical protein